MPGTYRARGIVLRRTKLGETDLIVTLLCDVPTQVRAVAKGARKPGARLAGIVDLGNEVELLLHRGRNLDTVSEGRLVASRASLAFDVDRSAMASAILDCAADLTVEGEHDARLYPLTSAALETLAVAPCERLELLGAAYLFKAAAMQGYRPSLGACVGCGDEIDLTQLAHTGARLAFSLAEGGVLCARCAHAGAAAAVDAAVLSWVGFALGSRFGELAAGEMAADSARLGRDLLLFARAWLGYYPGIHPRALDFVLDAALW